MSHPVDERSHNSLPNDKMPRLLTLPGEIKNKIWGYCVNNVVQLVHQGDTSAHTPHINGAAIWVPGDDMKLPNPYLGLLLTCKSVYYEVKDLPSSTTEVSWPSCSCYYRCKMLDLVPRLRRMEIRISNLEAPLA